MIERYPRVDGVGHVLLRVVVVEEEGRFAPQRRHDVAESAPGYTGGSIPATVMRRMTRLTRVMS